MIHDAMVLLARGAFAGVALLGLAVVILGGARMPLVLGFVAIGILTVTVVEAWGLLASTPLVALTVVFAAGGPIGLAVLVVIATGIVGLVRWLRARRQSVAIRSEWRVS